LNVQQVIGADAREERYCPYLGSQVDAGAIHPEAP
jgi:hypothetical protein